MDPLELVEVTIKEEPDPIGEDGAIPKESYIKLVDVHKCSECDMTFVGRSALDEHVESVHMKKEPPVETPPFYKKVKKSKACKVIGCSYVGRNLGDHVRRVHIGLKNHVCDYCDFAFYSAKELRTHVKAVHAKIRDHKCGECDFACSQLCHLQVCT